MQVVSFADQLFYTTVHLIAESNGGGAWSGTGFVYQDETGEGVAPFLVTNRHVLEGADRIKVRMAVRDQDNEPLLGRSTEITVHLSTPGWWTGHPSLAVDVAVAPIAPVVLKMREIGSAPYYRAIGGALIPDQGQLDALDAIEPVMFAGYPAGLFDKHNFTPIVRQGVTASRLQLDYNGLPAFLIDASVFPGSSGSPVFLSTRTMTVARDGGVTIGHQMPLLLGVLSAVHEMEVQGEVVELPTRYVARMRQALNLGVVFKSRAVIECVDLALQIAGSGGQQPAA